VGEVVPLEEQGLARAFGQRIGRTIAEVQPGRMSSLAEASEGLARDIRLLLVESNDPDLRLAQGSVKFPTPILGPAALGDHARLQNRHRGKQAKRIRFARIFMSKNMFFILES